jgi:hypothetical protein
MTRLGRLIAVALVLLSALAFGPAPARADCSNPLDPDFGDCTPPPGGSPAPTPDHTPTPKPATPKPAPTAVRTASPTQRPRTGTTSRTPAPTAIDNVEVPTVAPNATPEIIVSPIDEEEPLDVAEPSASASSWIFGFVVGLVVGGFVGRASWGLRRRRRQQIFG